MARITKRTRHVPRRRRPARLGVKEESERRQRLYDTILSNTPDLVYVFDLDHRFIYANDALLKMWGKTWDQAIGRNCLELGYPDWHAAMHDREIEQVKASRKAVRGEVPFTGTNGRRIYDYIFAPVFDDKGDVEAIAGTTRDVTDMREHAARLTATVAARTGELKRSIEELERFTYTVAHDLRAPLRSMHRCADILLTRRDKLAPEAVDEYLRQVTLGAERLDKLIEDLLAYSKVGQAPLQLERVDLGRLVGEVVDLFSVEIGESGTQLQVASGGYPPAIGDRVLISQALTNLLSNALKFVPEDQKPRVEIGAESTEGMIRLWVRDNGIGIEPQFRGKIFKLFERLHGRELYPGTGIGLAIVRRAVERMGGQVGFESTLGEGSRFWFTLKAAKDDA